MARIAGHHVPGAGLVLFAAEAAVVGVAARAGWAASDAPGGATILAVVVCAIALQLAFYWVDLYDVRVAASDSRRGQRLLFALGSTFAVAAPVTMVAPAAVRAAVPVALAAAAVGAAALRAFAPWEPLRRRVLVVGAGPPLDMVLKEIGRAEDVVVGVERKLGPRVVSIARDRGAQLVVVALDERRGVAADGLLELRLAGVQVREAVDYLESAVRKVPVDLVRPGAMIYGDGFHRAGLRDAGHRAVSLLAAGFLALLFAPVAAVVALLIKLDSRGPVIYKQERSGKNGVPFLMWKFRTMTADAEAGTGAVWAQKNDPRVTRVGRFLRRTRLDELPQLWNILRGDMDLVGPRPERPEFVERLAQLIPYYQVRSLVRPGLTGWAQICYPYGASVEDAKQKLAYDLYYVKHGSPLLDAIVLFHTAKVVVLGRGAR